MKDIDIRWVENAKTKSSSLTLVDREPWNDYPETIDEVLDFLDQFTESKHGMEFAKTVALLLGITIH